MKPASENINLFAFRTPSGEEPPSGKTDAKRTTAIRLFILHPRRDHASTSGFTLMETIVAFVVFTAVFIALERSTALGWHGIRLARMDQSALALARTKLATFGLNNTIPEETSLEGEENGLTWQLTAVHYKPPEASPMPPRRIPYWVTVTVSWRDRPMAPSRTIELTTIKSGAPE
ncbi:MAG: hypothetical protein ABL901_16505 [Hyphomicrobiaceae bacterium]